MNWPRRAARRPRPRERRSTSLGVATSSLGRGRGLATVAGSLADLNESLRPALLRIGERIARLLVRLPKNLDRATIRAAGADGLREPYLANASRRDLADAVAAYVTGMPR